MASNFSLVGFRDLHIEAVNLFVSELKLIEGAVRLIKSDRPFKASIVIVEGGFSTGSAIEQLSRHLDSLDNVIKM